MPLEKSRSDSIFTDLDISPSIECHNVVPDKVLNELFSDEKLSTMLVEVGNEIAAFTEWVL